MLFLIYVLIYVGVGSFKPKKQKNRVSSVALPCAVAMAHGKVTLSGRVPRRVPERQAHGKAPGFAVCPRSGTRRSLDVHRVSTAQAHGEQLPTPSTDRDGVCSLFFAVCL